MNDDQRTKDERPANDAPGNEGGDGSAPWEDRLRAGLLALQGDTPLTALATALGIPYDALYHFLYAKDRRPNAAMIDALAHSAPHLLADAFGVALGSGPGPDPALVRRALVTPDEVTLDAIRRALQVEAVVVILPPGRSVEFCGGAGQ